MKFCPKCHKKMQLGEGNVSVKVGDSEMKTTAPIYSRIPCDQHTANFQFRVEPIVVNANIEQEEQTEKRELNA